MAAVGFSRRSLRKTIDYADDELANENVGLYARVRAAGSSFVEIGTFVVLN